MIYIKSGAYGNTFKGIVTDDNDDEVMSFAVKIVAYPKKDGYGSMYNVTRPENAEICMLKLLSYFVIRSQTPHLILPIATFNTSIKPFLTLQEDEIVAKDNQKYTEKNDLEILEKTNFGSIFAFSDFIIKNNFSLKDFNDKLEIVYQSIYYS